MSLGRPWLSNRPRDFQNSEMLAVHPQLCRGAQRACRSFSVSAAAVGVPAANVVIVGGGAMGSSTAFWLARAAGQRKLNVVVIERDPSYARASTGLSVGSIRQQFSVRENVEMSLFGAQFLKAGSRAGAEGIQFVEGGYLFLASGSRGEEVLMRNVGLQRSLGAQIVLLSPTEIVSSSLLHPRALADRAPPPVCGVNDS